MKSNEDSPKVFISYSHDSEEHKTWVLNLATNLVKKGVEVLLDQWDLSIGADFVKYMERSVTEADRVLMICTEKYVKKADEGKGGAGYEAMIVTGELVRDLGTRKFFPIIRQTREPQLVPKFLATRVYIDFSDDDAYKARFVDLIKQLHNIPIKPKPSLGKNPFSKQKSRTKTARKIDIQTVSSPAKNPSVVASRTSESWISDEGEDEYGAWAEFTVSGIVQRMRWINHGQFLMGSPENEPERDDNERLHKVTLTNGFWIADTACSQELWKAVMGKNPSYFVGDKKPVERVSWDDCMRFIEKIIQVKGGGFRLPTEAEWEYACRAGTTTPFWFGNNISAKEVNFDSLLPYNNAPKSESRRSTVEVKSLPPNGWGLYETHGNVCEWCSDWFGKYSTGEVIDPTGPSGGEYRVLRGGGWILYGRDVRSAYRFGSQPDYRNVSIGFRLARGQ